jgi:acyl-CoA synthetase
VTRRLTDLGITVFRSYGSSEHPSITGSTADAPQDKRLLTDGEPMPGVEIRLAEDGEIYSRGGENISALEVDEVLLAMPGISEAVVVAASDAGLGERVAAVLRLKVQKRLVRWSLGKTLR